MHTARSPLAVSLDLRSGELTASARGAALPLHAALLAAAWFVLLPLAVLAARLSSTLFAEEKRGAQAEP